MAKNLLSFVEQEKKAKNDKKNDKTKKLNFWIDLNVAIAYNMNIVCSIIIEV